MNQPIRYHGGKSYIANRIVGLMPKHDRYLEAYAGGLSVLFAKTGDDVAEWVNDTNGELANFWATLRSEGQFANLLRWCESQPLEQRAFDLAKRYKPIVLGSHDDADAYRAFMFFVKMRMSRQGLGKDYCTPTSRLRRGMNEQVSAWLSAVDGLPEAHARLRRVEVWNRPAVEAIKALDSPTTLVYADPPYLHETRSTKGEYGDHEMSKEDHCELLHTLAAMKGKFILSGYMSDMYATAELKFRWHRIDIELPNNASSSKTKERKIERLWMNFDPKER